MAANDSASDDAGCQGLPGMLIYTDPYYFQSHIIRQ